MPCLALACPSCPLYCPALLHLAPAQLCPAKFILPCPSLPLLSLALARPSPAPCPVSSCPVSVLSCLYVSLPSNFVLPCLSLPCPDLCCPHHVPVAVAIAHNKFTASPPPNVPIVHHVHSTHPCFACYDAWHAVQVNIDFESEQDMVEKARIGLALQPVATALFANSPFRDGKPTGQQPAISAIAFSLCD